MRIIIPAFLFMISFITISCDDKSSGNDIGNPNDTNINNTCKNDFNTIAQKTDEAVSKYSLCESNEDCTTAYIDIKCLGSCPVSINVNDVNKFEEELKNIADKYCIDDCKGTPNCEIREPECQNNKCVMVRKNPDT